MTMQGQKCFKNFVAVKSPSARSIVPQGGFVFMNLIMVIQSLLAKNYNVQRPPYGTL